MKNLFDSTISPIIARKVVGTTKKRYEFIVAYIGLSPEQELSANDLLTVKLIYDFGWLWGEDPTSEYIVNSYMAFKNLDWEILGSPKITISVKYYTGETYIGADFPKDYSARVNFNMVCQELIEELRKYDIPGFNYYATDLPWRPDASDAI